MDLWNITITIMGIFAILAAVNKRDWQDTGAL